MPLRVVTLLPADWAILEGLGIAPLRGEEFRLADGATVRRTTGGALFRSEDGVGVANVMFGEAGEKLYRQLETMLAQPKTPVKLRAQIVMFLIERLHGKAPQRVDLEAGGDLVDLILAAARIAEGEKP